MVKIMKKIYRIMENEMEFRSDYIKRIGSCLTYHGEIVFPEEGCTLKKYDQYPEEVGRFESIEAAREALKKYKTSLWDYGKVCYVTEYYIVEGKVDDYDDDEVEDFDIWEFTPMIYKVIEYGWRDEEVARFDNYEDAEEECKKRELDAMDDDESDSLSWDVYVGNWRISRLYGSCR